jgi:hypothetical protein
MPRFELVQFRVRSPKVNRDSVRPWLDFGLIMRICNLYFFIHDGVNNIFTYTKYFH